MRSRSAPLLIVASPILLLIGGGILALCLAADPSMIARQLRESAVQDALWLSLRTTVISLLVICACGVPLALLIRRRGPLANALEFLITLPAIMPPSVAGIALLLAFGRQGLFGAWLASHGIVLGFTPAAVVMAQTFVATPFFVREAANGFQAVQPSVLDAARLDGGATWPTLRYVVLPIAAPFLVTGAILSWARALSEFGATILFAGSLQGVTQTLPIAIYLGFETSLDEAKAIAIILLIVAALLLVILRLVFRRSLVYAH